MEIYTLTPPQGLTEEEKKSPYAHLYDLPILTPDEAILKEYVPGHPMDPSLALPITEMETVFTPGALKQCNGYCLLPDGTGYCATKVEMPDVTEEMEAFWGANGGWLNQDDVNYKVWLPGMHFEHKHPVVENLGWGVGNIDFVAPLILPEILTRDPRELDPDYITYSGCSGTFTLHSDPNDIEYNTILNVVRRRQGGGLEVQTVNWFGVFNIHNQAVRKIPEGTTDDLERVRRMGCHNGWENTRKNQILPLVYEIARKNGQV